MNYVFALHKGMQQRQHEKSVWIWPVHLAMYATYLRDKGHHVFWDVNLFDYVRSMGSKNMVVIRSEDHIRVPFFDLPAPDRILTDAMNPKWQNNGNFKHKPGTYILAASGCWWGKCAFCVEKGKPYHRRSVDSVLDEINQCQALGFREVFDDSGTFPDGDWLREFCLKRKGTIFPKISCNMRVGADVDFDMMREAGFRMLLYGVESANQKTLNKINKGTSYERIVSTIQQAAKAGLSPHIAVMFGYSWEEDQDSSQTVRLVRLLLKNGYAKTAQASIYMVEGEEPKEECRKYIKQIFNIWRSPRFWWNKLKDIKSKDDLKYLMRQIKEGLNQCLTRS